MVFILIGLYDKIDIIILNNLLGAHNASYTYYCIHISIGAHFTRISLVETIKVYLILLHLFTTYTIHIKCLRVIVCSLVYNSIVNFVYFKFQTKQMIERLQTLVSSDGRFRNMRDALHRSDPPCIPYLGMYLTDLSFIEEGTQNVTDDSLVNFSKMRMVCFSKFECFLQYFYMFCYISLVFVILKRY